MKSLMIIAAGITLSLSGAAFAEGDAAAGEKVFKKCKACHGIVNGDEAIQKGGKTGPNLYAIIGRVAGSEEFKFSASMIAAGEGGLIWDEEQIVKYILDPKAYLREVTGDPKAKSKMTFKLKKGGEDVAAYLASVGPAVEPAAE